MGTSSVNACLLSSSLAIAFALCVGVHAVRLPLMPALRAQVTIPTTTGGPSDVSMNTLYFRASDLTDSGLSAIVFALAQFYNSLKSRYPLAMNFAAASVVFYNMADPKPRPPIYESLLGTTGTGSGTSGPAEVAICLSFHGVQIPGLRFARSRGRIYIGPLASSLMVTASPPQALIDNLTGAGQALLDASGAAPWSWVVWSQKQSDDPQGLTFPDQDVVGGWVDNAWDTQRRRGVAATGRNLFGNLPTLLPAFGSLLEDV